MWECAICHDFQPTQAVLDHFRLMHPEVILHDDELWPDGQHVIYEDADDFFL